MKTFREVRNPEVRNPMTNLMMTRPIKFVIKKQPIYKMQVIASRAAVILTLPTALIIFASGIVETAVPRKYTVITHCAVEKFTPKCSCTSAIASGNTDSSNWLTRQTKKTYGMIAQKFACP